MIKLTDESTEMQKQKTAISSNRQRRSKAIAGFNMEDEME